MLSMWWGDGRGGSFFPHMYIYDGYIKRGINVTEDTSRCGLLFHGLQAALRDLYLFINSASIIWYVPSHNLHSTMMSSTLVLYILVKLNMPNLMLTLRK